MNLPSRKLLMSVILLSLSLTGFAQDTLTRHVSQRLPVLNNQRELSAMRATSLGHGLSENKIGNVSKNTWKLLATIPGSVIHDITFTSPTTGYAVAEQGHVWKTTNGGANWTQVLNAGGSYYFYGVAAAGNTIVISGFYDSSTFYSLIRWSYDGGATWTDDIVLSPTDWLQRVHFANRNHGLIMDLIGGSSGNAAQFTTDGGAGVNDWTSVVDNTDGGWFGLQFSLLSNLHARASGINFCDSANGGQQWTCGPSVDSVFDGPTSFLNDKDGWVGGGEISPNVEGWVHVTTDGGKTWSGRTLDGPWPIRQFLFVTAKRGWATGGNLYTNVGGMYYTSDGGQTWTIDADTGNEMDACAGVPYQGGAQIWCAGYNASFNGVIYSTRIK